MISDFTYFVGGDHGNREGGKTRTRMEKLSDGQLQYCSNDVIYLHKIKEDLNKMLLRENRIELYENSIKFLKTRIKLDQQGFTEDIFSH